MSRRLSAALRHGTPLRRTGEPGYLCSGWASVFLLLKFEFLPLKLRRSTTRAVGNA